MGIKSVVSCDNCGVEKPPNENGWFLALFNFRQTESKMDNRLIIRSFSQQFAEDQRDWDILCGEACIHEWISKNLSRINPPTPRPGVSAEPKATEIPEYCPINTNILKKNCKSCQDEDELQRRQDNDIFL